MAQPEINKEAIKLVDSANAAFCKNDTLATIAILENIEKLYPSDGVVAISNKALADLYIAQGRIKDAKEKLLYGVSYTKTSVSVSNRTVEGCPQIIFNRDLITAKAESCVSLSRLFLQDKQFASSLYYLQQAETKFNPYKNCGNGSNMYCVYLTPFFVDHYLAMGDTSKAIARLLNYFMMHDGNTEPVTKKLKELLLQKYTQQQITAAVKKGLRDMWFTKAVGNDDAWYMNITWFGLTTKYNAESRSHIKDCMKYYRNDRSAKMLCDADALK
jgi:tetratricopeptide (TPR) repeat protein